MRDRLPLLVLLVLGWWTLNGFVWVGQVVTMHQAAGQPADWPDTLRQHLASAWLWVPITLAMFAWVGRHPIERGRVMAALAMQGLAVAVAIVLRAAAVVALNGWIGWYERLPPLGELLAASVLNNLLTSWLIVGVAHALVYAERARRRERQAMELEARLARARLDALTAQLNPHFLFNALNSIAEMVHRDPDGADRMLVDLGALLRHSLDRSHRQEIALRDELVALDHYIGIEKIRLGERLRMHWAIDSALLDAQVPQLLLQPLVENAIHHAVAMRSTPGEVSVRAERREDCLILEVSDDGGAGEAVHGAGIGLSNTRARLQGLYGDAHRFDIGARAAGGTWVRLELPYRRWQPLEAAA